MSSSDSKSPSAHPDTAKYTVGQVIHHTLFDYRGVIVDVDSHFRVGGEMMAQERKPVTVSDRAQPWYHVLVDGTANRTYVSEHNLEPDYEGGPIDHPDVIDYFDKMTDRGYVSRSQKVN